MKISRRFTAPGDNPFDSVKWVRRSSRITNPDGSVVFEMKDAEVPESWSQLATDIMVSKYFRKAGVPQVGADGQPVVATDGKPVTGPEKSARQVIHRLAGCWRHWGESHGYFDTPGDAQAFYDELVHMMVHQVCAPNSPQWFNTGLNFAYGLTGPAQGHCVADPKTGEVTLAHDAYTHPQPHACQPYHALVSTPQGPVPIGEIVTKGLTGLEVYDGTDNGKGVTRVVAAKANGDQAVFRIVLKNGVCVEATGDHLVLAFAEGAAKPEWLRVDALTPGMRLQLSTVTTVTKSAGEREALDAAMAGWLQGDGFVGQYEEGTNRSLTVEFMTINDDEFQFVMNGVRTCFEGVHHHVRHVESQDPNLDIRRIRLYGEKLRPFVEKYGLLRAGDDLAVPAAVRTGGIEAQAAYLRAIFQTDGTVRLRARATHTSDVVLTTVSRPLALGVQAMLLNLGIYSRVQEGVERRENRRTPYFVSIGYAEARARFRDLIGFVSAAKKAKLDVSCSEKFAGKGLPPLREETIQRIEAVGVMPVFDIQTQSGQYLCNNVIVHNCFIQGVVDDLVSPGGIMDLWVREARLFKYGSGTGTNFSRLRAENEPLSGGGKSSGLMSWLRIGDRAAGAIKSGGTTRRAAKMVCLDMDHPDIEAFINWKVREEIKVAAMVEGMKHLAADQRKTAEKLGLRLDYDFNGEAYYTVSGQNSNNSVRMPDAFLDAVAADGEWVTTWRTSGKPARTFRARSLWDQIAFAAWRCADPGVQFDTTINAWHTCPGGGRINASNPCVTGDTLVATADGYRRIDALVGRTVEVVNGNGEKAWVDRVFRTGRKPVFELKTASGYRLRLTADHKVFTANRGDVPAAELTVDDRVVLRGPGFGGDFLPPGFAELLGAAVGDGCITRGQKQDHLFVTMSRAEAGVAERLRLHIDQAKARVATGDARSTPPAGVVATATGLRVGTSVRGVLERLSDYAVLDRGSEAKAFTDAVYTLDRSTLAAILRGLFTTDGTVANYGAKSQYVALDSVSLTLLRQVQQLLLAFGIKAKIYENRRALGQVSARLPDGRGGEAEYPVRQVHCLRVSRASRAAFEREIGFLAESPKAQRLAELNRSVSTFAEPMSDRVASLTPCGEEDVFDLTEPRSHHFVANGMVVHNCSEYMFLDNTACNLASINILKFYDPRTRAFDTAAFEHAIDLWTIVLEISVLMAAFPSREIAELSWKYRTLGLGYANLGALLMQAGVPYDSDEARALCGCLTAILTGRAYRQSALMARELGPFAGFEADRRNMLRVVRNHRLAARGEGRGSARYEDLRIRPVPIDHALVRSGRVGVANAAEVLDRAVEAWDQALELGERHGYRNAQVTVIAPTGTIGLLMDCDTTGVEPDFALVKFKKLAGGGYFKIANDSVKPALEALGYTPVQVRDILTYLLGTLNLQTPLPRGVKGAQPGETLAQFLIGRGLTEEDLERVTDALPGVFELPFAFAPWALGDDALRRLRIDPAKAKADPAFSTLRALGLSDKHIDALNSVICGTQTLEGAPHLRAEQLPVFDCASPCGKTGTRFIRPEGHIRMMAAAQPFISGAISKTINLPAEATVEDIKSCYWLSWELGLKANALYRDGSKLSQPLNTKADTPLAAEAEEEDDELERSEAHEEVASAVGALAAAAAQVEPKAVAAREVEVVHRPMRRRLPDTRDSITHKFNIAGHEGYLTVGLYEDGKPGELFITMAKEGSTIGGLMDSLGTATSVALQYGVPVESLVTKFTHQRFEPAGITANPDIPFAKSLVDYIFRWLGMRFIPGYREANAPRRGGEDLAPPPATARVEGRAADPRPARPLAAPPPARTANAPAGAAGRAEAVVSIQSSTLTIALESVADAPPCDVCGTITVRSGTCYKCLNCGNSMGCS